MKHYLQTLEGTIHNNWDLAAVADYGGQSFTYGELATNIEAIWLFFEKVGIKKGDKIALCARNSARWAISFWAVNTYETVIVPLLADFHPDSIVNLVNHSESVLLFTDTDIWNKLDPQSMPMLKAAINVGDLSVLWSCDEAVASAWEQREKLLNEKYPDGFKQENVHYPSDNFSELAIINYTSGTSGDPKGVMLTYGAMSDIDEFSNAHFPNTPGQTMVSMLPLAHMYGLAIEFIHPNVDGVTIYFLGKAPSPTTLFAAMKEVKPYMVITVPLVMEKVYTGSIRPALSKLKIPLAIPLVKRLIYRKIRNKLMEAFGGNVGCFILGGAPLKPEVEKCLKKIRLPFTVGYGMTEACPLLAYVWWTKFVPGSCGIPVHELRIDSSDPQHIPGEIQARGANLTIGYYKNPEANAMAFTDDGWFRTGDLGIIDKNGNVFIRGRIKSMILTASGQNIYPEEIESVLSGNPFVSESVVVERGGKLVALVYPEIPEDTDPKDIENLPKDIADLANESLPKYSQIAKVEFVDTPFEKTPKMSIKRYLYK
ncbi:MAG: AMP-binding protein [Bacteroidales bacterium]|nr:AMP-binding protein [Bacteroidales bacterium]